MKILFSENSVVKKHIAPALIKGLTTKQGTPISCPVCAYSRKTGELLSKTTSKADGSYVLFGSNQFQNYVIAIDPSNEYNLAAQDNVK